MGCVHSTSKRTMQTPQFRRESIEQPKPIDKSHFLFNNLIGEGGFGKVYSAVLARSRNWFAVKEINKHALLQHKTGVDMLMNELKALEQVEHPFVIRLHFAFHDYKSCFLVFDLKTGADLRHYLRKRMVFGEVDVAFYVACISSALAHIHSRDIIHRDIKPENIVLDSRGYPHLTDFGVAYVKSAAEVGEGRTYDGILTSTLASGTKQYLAPEVFTKLHVHGIEADYWSLGVVAYELLFGKRPFDKHCPSQFIQYIENAYNMMQRRLKRLRRAERVERNASTSSTKATRGDKTSPDVMLSTTFSASDCGAQGSDTPSTIGHPSSPMGFMSDRSDESSPVCGRIFQLSTASASSSPMKSTKSIAPFSPSSLPSINSTVCGAKSSISSISPVGGSSNSSHLKGVGGKWVPVGPAVEHLLGDQQSGSANPYVNHNKYQQQLVREPGRLEVVVDLVTECDHAHSASGRQEECDSIDDTCSSSSECAADDHWAVTHGELPSYLKVPIPLSTPWLGDISDSCIDLLEGLFELRPCYRLGARNLSSLQNHDWLVSRGFGKVEDLMTKQFTPPFCPGKRGSILSQDIDLLSPLGCLVANGIRSDSDEAYEPQFISPKDQAKFSSFNFVSQHFQSKVEDESTLQKDMCPSVKQVSKTSTESNRSVDEYARSQASASQKFKFDIFSNWGSSCCSGDAKVRDSSSHSESRGHRIKSRVSTPSAHARPKEDFVHPTLPIPEEAACVHAAPTALRSGSRGSQLRQKGVLSAHVLEGSSHMSTSAASSLRSPAAATRPSNRRVPVNTFSPIDDGTAKRAADSGKPPLARPQLPRLAAT